MKCLRFLKHCTRLEHIRNNVRQEINIQPIKRIAKIDTNRKRKRVIRMSPERTLRKIPHYNPAGTRIFGRHKRKY